MGETITTSATASPQRACRWCAGYHSGSCPRVRLIRYDQYNQVREVEVWPDVEAIRGLVRDEIRKASEASSG